MGIGKTLKELLNNKGMTARELSEQTGISINTIYAILKRDNDSIKPESLLKICNILDVSPNYILGIPDRTLQKMTTVEYKISLINKWFCESPYKINLYENNIYTISDHKRHIGIYISLDDIEQIYHEMVNSCEYTIDKFIFERLKKEDPDK